MISKERLKEFETVIKKYIIFRFQKFLPESSVVLLTNNDYSNIDYNDEKLTENDAKCDIIRNMLYDIISVVCELNVEVSKGNYKDVIYGEHLENGLIEFYALEIAKANDVDFKIDPDNKEDLAMVLEIYRVLNNKLDYMTFTSNAIEILEAADLDEITELNDNYAIDEYINNAVEITKSKGIAPEDLEEQKKKEEELKKQEIGSQEELEQMNKEFAIDGVLQIIYTNGKRKVKYTDEYNVTHILNVDDNYALSDIYRREFAKTKKGESIDSKKVFEELKQKFGEMPLDDELDERKINPDKVKQTEFVNQSGKFKEKINDGKVVFNEDADTFVLPETKEVVEAHTKGEGIEATVSGKQEEETTALGPEDINPVSDASLVKENPLDQEQIDSIMENAENNKLSLEELRDLKAALIEEAKQQGEEKEAERIAEEVGVDELQKINSELQEKGPKLKKKSAAAYVNKPLLFFILCMVISISLIIGVTIAYFK
ncbi:MAG: hypothetical protein IJK67_04580 [Bacilli bacterium]|nr:hypothetical protein [Bacilli bacterium]